MKEGRPTKYDPGYNEIARKLCLLGHTDKELAKFFEVDRDTIKEWKSVYPEFSASVNAGKLLADSEVASSFHKRAVGYQYEEVTYEKIIIKEGEGFMKTDDVDNEGISVDPYKKKVVVKEVAPDPGAALNWLKNRQPKKWRDKQELGITDKKGKDVPPTSIIFTKGMNGGRDSNK